MSDHKCPNCKRFMLFPNSHTCPPAWLVKQEWDSDPFEALSRHHKVYADTAEEAAEKFAVGRLYDGATSSSGMIMLVCTYPAMDKVYTVEVEIEMVPQANGRVTNEQPYQSEEEDL